MLAVAVGAGAVSAEGDADPRPEPHEGTRPNENVPTTATGALADNPFNERTEIPAGNWILHDNGWTAFESKAAAREFANETTQTYVIDGETFVLDDFEDWDYNPGSEDADLLFEYVTPPKPKGKTYEIRWEFESGGKYPGLENLFPFTNRVEIVSRNRAGD